MSQQALARIARKVLAATYENPSQWLLDALSAGRSDAGVPITFESSLTSTTVWACCDMVCGEVGGLPLNDTSIDSEGDKTVNQQSDVQWLLNQEPNEIMTALNFRRAVQLHAMCAGNGYAGIQRDGASRPVSLMPIYSQRVRPYYDDDMRLWYDVQGFPNPISAQNMLHIAGLGSDGVCGYSVFQKARNAFGLTLASEQHGSSHFKNGASPKVVLKTDRNLTEDEAKLLLKMWSEDQEGSENAGKTALAAGGLEIEALPISNEDSQWLQSRAFQREEIAAWFGVPSHMVGGPKGPYNSTIAENQAYLRRTLKKWLCGWEQECQKKLFPRRVRRQGQRFLFHDTSQLLSSDPETQAKIETQLVNGEIKTRNEARRKLGLNRSDDPIADRLSSPSTRNDNSATDTQPSEVPAQAQAAHRRLMCQRLEKLIDTERKNILRGAKTKDFVSWLDTFYGRFTKQVEEAMDPFIAAYNATPGLIASLTAAEIAETHTESSKSQLLDVAGISYRDTIQENVSDLTNTWTIRASDMADAVIGITK